MRQSIPLGYGFAFAMFGLAALAEFILHEMLLHIGMAVFLCAIEISVWCAGTGPGVMVLILGALVLDSMACDPMNALECGPGALRLYLIEFFLVAGAMMTLTMLLRRALDRSNWNLALLDALFNAAPVGLAFLDTELRYVRLNETIAKLNGVPAQDHLGRRPSELLPKFHDEALRVIGQVLATGEPVVNRKLHRIRESGDPYDALVNYYPVRSSDGEIIGVGGVVVDITQQQQAENARDRLTTYLQLLMNSIEEGIIGVGLDGRLSFSNPAAARMLGYSPEELIGEELHSIVHAQGCGNRDTSNESCLLQNSVRSGKSMHVDEGMFGRRDGTAFPVEFSVFPIRSTETSEGVAIIFNDISLRKRAEETRVRLIREEARRAETEVALARLETILDSALNAVVYVDAKTGRAVANPEAMRLLGPGIDSENWEEVLDRIRVYDLTGKLVPHSELPSQRALMGESVSSQEYVLVRSDGQRVSILENAAAVKSPDGTIRGAVLVFQDITGLKEMQKRREEWMSLIAHDLRQPITAIVGYADMLLLSKSRLSSQDRARLGQIRASSYQLNRMISDLLDVSRIESRRLSVTLLRIDLAALVQDVLVRLEDVLAGCVLESEIAYHPMWVLADPGRIEQILTNLLTNAAKYRYPGTPVQIRAEGKAGMARVTVVNRGPGIQPDEVPLLFTQFYRTRSAQSSEVTGLGLGLYISKELVEAQGGSINVESDPGNLTSFTFTIPLAATATPEKFTVAAPNERESP